MHILARAAHDSGEHRNAAHPKSIGKGGSDDETICGDRGGSSRSDDGLRPVRQQQGALEFETLEQFFQQPVEQFPSVEFVFFGLEQQTREQRIPIKSFPKKS